MPASSRRFTARPQLEKRTPLVAAAAAQAVVDELSRWLACPLPARYTAGLAHRARRCFAHSPRFRARVSRRSDAGRETLYVFLRHWLAARLHAERPDLFARLPAGYATGAAPPPRPAVEVPLSNQPRLLAAW